MPRSPHCSLWLAALSAVAAVIAGTSSGTHGIGAEGHRSLAAVAPLPLPTTR
jgi:hypothetical protein